MSNANTRKACKITDEIIQLCIRNIRQFRTEKDIDRFLRTEARKRKCRIAFPPVVAIGKNASEIHHKPKNARIRKGFLIIDFGIKCNGHCSDITRTLYIGKPSKKEKEIYAKVLAVQKAGVRNAKAGAEGFEVDYRARKKFGNLRELFIHSLGHGVGKKIHQKPNLSPKSPDRLKLGDAITIEPGIYVKGKLGIRIEDTIIVGKNSGVVLTKTSKKLITA